MNKDAWYIQRENQIIGPYSLEDLIQQKQSGQLFDHDFVWQEGLPGWTRVFYVNQLRLSSDYTGLNRRRYPRYKINSPCIITNSDYSHLGKIITISKFGVAFQAEFPNFQIGEEVKILIRKSEDLLKGLVVDAKIRNKQFIPHKVQFRSRCEYVASFFDEINLGSILTSFSNPKGEK